MLNVSKVAEIPKSCRKDWKLPESCRATCGQGYLEFSFLYFEDVNSKLSNFEGSPLFFDSIVYFSFDSFVESLSYCHAKGNTT